MNRLKVTFANSLFVDIRNRLDEYCHRNRVSVTEVLNDALEEYLDKKEAEEQKTAPAE